MGGRTVYATDCKSVPSRFDSYPMDTYPIVDFLKLSCYTHFLTMHNLERVIRTGVGMVMSYGLVACTESRPVINPAYTPTPVAGGLKPDQLPGATETELTKPSFNFSETVPEGQKKEIEQLRSGHSPPITNREKAYDEH